MSFRSIALRVAMLTLGSCLWTAQAQQAGKLSLEELLARLTAAEERIKSLESRVEQKPAVEAAAAVPGPSTPVTPVPEPLPITAEAGGHDHGGGGSLIASGLQTRGFGDFQYVAGDHGTRSTFVLGQFDLFMTSKLSDHWNFLAESVIQADQSTNTFGFEIERLQLTYAASDYLNVSFGRYHQTIGYYNTAFHHGTWFQTTMGRPFIYEFEDGGGILPIHNVGVAVSGKLPSGKLNLRYAVEVGNGRTSRNREAEYVQNVLDENNRKSVNFALSSQPEWLHGLELGGSYLRDRLSPDSGRKVNQTVASSYAVYHHGKTEFLNEFVLMRNQSPMLVTNTPGYYSQISRGWHMLRPYLRYEYVNVNHNDPIFYDVGRRSGPRGGIRWDAGEFSAFKIEFARVSQTGLPDTNTIAAQVAFAF